MNGAYNVEAVVRDSGIVSDLAKVESPGRATEDGNCPLCGVVTEWTNEPGDHAEACPWRRAREACA